MGASDRNPIYGSEAHLPTLPLASGGFLPPVPSRSCRRGHFEHVREEDVVAWPTNLGWRMGPWLIFAALLNRATIALYVLAELRLVDTLPRTASHKVMRRVLRDTLRG